MRRIVVVAGLVATFVGFSAAQRRGGTGTRPATAAANDAFSRAFAPGWMLQDTNHDGLTDAIAGHIVVPGEPTAAENSAAANLAARLAEGTTGLTPPLVESAGARELAETGPRIYVGAGAVPAARAADVQAWTFRLAKGEGRVVVLTPGSAASDLALVGDDAGLDAAADAFSARTPYQWAVGTGRDELGTIAEAVNAAAPAAHATLVGLDYQDGVPGISKAYLTATGAITPAELAQAFAGGKLAAVHELFVLGGAAVSAVNPKPFKPQTFAAPTAGGGNGGGEGGAGTNNDEGNPPPATAGGGAGGRGAAGGRGGAASGGGAAGPSGLDLGNLYGSRGGLFASGGRVPVPGAPTAHLYVPAGEAGVAMANLAARMGLESTAITLPIASPAASANLRQIQEQPVVAGDSALAKNLEKRLAANDTAAAQAASALAAGEGQLRVVDRAFGSRAGILVRGDDAGAAAALELAAGHLPNVWEIGKQHESVEDIRYDLHQFFSLHSGVGQASAALFFLNRWLGEIGTAPATNIKAEIYADLADPKLASFVQAEIQKRYHVTADVTAASLRAGTQCCSANPDLHYDNPEFPFHQGTPVFTEDVHIPWEGTALLDDARAAAAKLTPGQAVTLNAGVSEGPEERRKLADQLRDILTKAGAGSAQVEVLDAYKQGYSWLEDEIAPALEALKREGKTTARLEISAAKDVDETGVRDMYSPARWMQELYPIDEVLAKKLDIPLDGISLHLMDTAPAVETPAQIALADPPNDPPAPTYRVRALDAAGNAILEREFTVATVMQPYSGVIPAYENVQVETGWLKVEQGGREVAAKRIPTDIEHFWEHYQSVTMPRVYRFVMAQAQGYLRPEYAPPFDTLKMDFHLSEPDYNIGVDKERISSIEALQEDVFYSTETFMDTLADLKSGRPENYVGRIIPVMHPSEDGKDGEVHIEFYGKPAANPMVRLSWTDAQGKPQTRERNLPVLTGAFQPRLIGARVKAGEPGIENLTWLLPADYKNYDMSAWEKLEGREQLERSMFTVEQARMMLQALDAMHAAGIYPDELAYPDLRHMAIELELPRPLGVAFTTPEERDLLRWNVSAPEHARPQIADIKPIATPEAHKYFVQWNEPIGPEESASILARLATFPGVNVYSMGRTYLGQVIWAADMTLPTPSALRSWAKETTEKASIVYSARQHANEVSSTSHVERLAEMLVEDPAVRDYLKQVNVVLHPIDNPDGAKLSVMEAKIVPDNLLHLGYHGALAADVSTGQADIDPVYPESRTRRLLIQQWNPDAFLNPHGYPSHEWVQPFSEYSAWVQSRNGANNGRTWWIPRGWFTSLSYARDTTTNTYSEAVTFSIRDRIVAAEREVPGLLPLETRMNDRYQRWGQAFQPDNMQQPVVGGIRIYMSLKGGSGGGGGQAGPGATAAVTWDQGYTEAPDETAHGDYMKLVASAGLAYDEVHLKYLALGKLRITRSERESAQGVTWSVTRARPILPSSEPPVAKPPDGK